MAEENAVDAALDDIYKETGTKPFLGRDKDKAPKDRAAGSDRGTKERGTSTGEPRSKASPTARRTSLERRLTELYVSVGTLTMAFDQPCGAAVVTAAPDIGQSLDQLATENPRVKKALERMLEGGAWGAVIMAHAPILTTVLAHHNMLPESMARAVGVEPRPRKPTPAPIRPMQPEEAGSVASGNTGKRT